MTQAELVEVTKADNEAAAYVLGIVQGAIGLARSISAGEMSNNPVVQAFAHHRIASILAEREECAQVAERVAEEAQFDAYHSDENEGAQVLATGGSIEAKRIANLIRARSTASASTPEGERP